MFNNGRLRSKIVVGQGVACRKDYNSRANISYYQKDIRYCGRNALKRKAVLLIALIISLALTFSGFLSDRVKAEEEGEASPINVEELIDNLDLSELDEYLDGLLDENSEYIGNGAKEYLQLVASGEKNFTADDVLKILSSALKGCLNVLPMISSIIAMCIIWSLATGIEWKNNSKTAKNAVNLACLSTMSVIVLKWLTQIISSVCNYLDEMKSLCDAVIPVLFTLLSASGAHGSTGALSPVAALLSVTLFALIKNVVIPVSVAVLLLSMAGSVSDDFPLNSLTEFFGETVNQIMRTGFFVFSAFMATQGIFTGIKDKISLRMGKFALSKYVPIIGGYLSDGFNYVIAGSIVIKNATGLMTLAIIFIRFIPLLVTLLAASVALKFACAVCEPLHVSCAVKMIKKTESCVSLLRAAVIGCTFLLIIFVGIVMTIGSTAV